MEIKTIEQIKEDVAKDFLHPYRTWAENARFSNDDNISVLEDSGAIDEAITRYSSQFQQQNDLLRERVAELERFAESIVSRHGKEGKTAWKLLNEINKEANSLINKGNETNNGWIAIESEKDLPSECWVHVERGSNVPDQPICYVVLKSYLSKLFEPYVTHYKPIIRPLPPPYLLKEKETMSKLIEDLK